MNALLIMFAAQAILPSGLPDGVQMALRQHEACFNGWGEMINLSDSNAELLASYRSKCAETRLTAFLRLRDLEPASGDQEVRSTEARNLLEGLELDWVMAIRSHAEKVVVDGRKVRR